MKLLDGSQILSNLQNNIPTDPLTIAGLLIFIKRKKRFIFRFSGQLVDWLPESMAIVIDCKSAEFINISRNTTEKKC